MHDPGAWTLPLSDPSCTDSLAVGGKAAGLARLLRDGLPVPETHVLPVSAFRAHFDRPTPAAPPERPALDRMLSTELSTLCARLCPAGEDYLVVRSSALGEDSAAASFAGQHATYYYVSVETIDKAVVDCWMSLWSEVALTYRRHRTTGAAPFGMAVIVQKMVQAERSGVCFTRDPTGSLPGTALIESTWGLGAALVDGRVSPDRFWVSADAIEDRRISRKRLKVGENLRDPDDQRLEPVPLDRQVQPTLTDIEVRQITDMAERIATARGEPQDVEWAIDGDELFVLQSRPLTVPDGNGDADAIEGRWVLFKPAAENFSEPLTPMTIDLMRRVLPPFGRFIRGRYYVNADVMVKLLPWSLDDHALSDLLLMRGPPPDDVSLDWPRVARAASLIALGYLSNGMTWHRTANLPLDTLAAFERRCRDALADEALDPLDTLKQLILNDHPFRPMGEFSIQANVSSIRYFLLIDALKALVRRFAPDFDQNKLAFICPGGEGMLSKQMVEGIRELAAIAGEDEDLARVMQNDGVNFQTLSAKLEDDHPFATALSQFLARFGHRGVREMDFASPRWREDTSTVLSMVRNHLIGGTEVHPAPGEPAIDGHGLLLATEDELHQAVRKPWQRRLIDRLVRRIRYYVTLRENTRHYHIMGIATVREKLKQLEHGLIQAGRLRCEDDIFFLEYPEALALDAGALDWRDVEGRIRDRRLRHQRRGQRPPAESFNLHLEPRGASHDANVLKGDCASPGVASGTARVIRDPAVAADLAPGDILVAPYTDPAWTPLFPGAAAVVVEVGSYLSHAGTVAREYQVPCLVDVHGCTRRIRSGQQLRVNATEGWVEILE